MNSSTLKYDFAPFNTKLKLGNNLICYEVTAKPKDYNTEDLTVVGKHASTYNPASGKLETTQSLKVGTPKVGPLRFWTTVSICTSKSYIII